MPTTEPTPGDQPKDEFKPAVNPAELKGDNVEKEIFEKAKQLYDQGVESLGLNPNTRVAEIFFLADTKDLPKDFFDNDYYDEDYEIGIKIVPKENGQFYIDYGYSGKYYGGGQFSHTATRSGYKSELYGDTYSESGVVSKDGDPNDLIVPLRYISAHRQVRVSAKVESQLKTE